MAFKCERCGKEFDSEHGLKIHVGRAHGRKRRTTKKARAKAGRKGKFVCAACGRSFKMAMHLARHRTAAHGAVGKAARARKRAARRAVRRAGRAASVAGLNIGALTVDQLLALKNAVDGRLTDIAAQLKKAHLR